MTSFYFNYLFKDLISKQGHILSRRIQHINWGGGGHNSAHNISFLLASPEVNIYIYAQTHTHTYAFLYNLLGYSYSNYYGGIWEVAVRTQFPVASVSLAYTKPCSVIAPFLKDLHIPGVEGSILSSWQWKKSLGHTLLWLQLLLPELSVGLCHRCCGC